MRYQAGGQFGSGFKARPKSDAGIREVPLAPLVIESIRRQLPADRYPDLLVFTGPSRYNFRRIYQRALSHAQAMTLLTSIRTVPTICATPSRPGWKTPTFPLG